MQNQVIKKSSLLAAVIFLSSQCAWAAVYNVDADHTTVSFKIRHLLSKTMGSFNKFEGTIEYEPGKPETWKAQGSIDVASIDTSVPQRDKHLLSADFFDAEKYPKITFKTTGVQNVKDNRATVNGTIHIHGVEKPITLDVEILGVAKDPWGNVRSAFTAKTTLNRKDFGIVWNKTLDTGSLMLGEEVEITLEIEGIQV